MQVVKAHYRWSYDGHGWLLCEGFSPAIHRVRLK